MSTNRIDIFGIVGSSAKTLQERLDALLTDPAIDEEITYDANRRFTHPLMSQCESIVHDLHREKDRLPVLSHCSYIDGRTIGTAHADILGWPDDRPRFLLPDVNVLWYYPGHQLQELSQRLRAYRRRVVFKRELEFRLYCNRLAETIEALMWIDAERLVIVAPKCFGASRTRSHIDDAP